MRNLKKVIYALIYVTLALLAKGAFQTPYRPLHAIVLGLLVGLIALRAVTYVAEGISIKPGSYANQGDQLGFVCLVTLVGVAIWMGIAWQSALSAWVFVISAICTWIIQVALDPVLLVQGDMERTSFKLIKILTVIGWLALFASYITIALWTRYDPSLLQKLEPKITNTTYTLAASLAFWGQIFWGLTASAVAGKHYRLPAYDFSPLLVAGAPIAAMLLMTLSFSRFYQASLILGELILVAAVYWALYSLAKPPRSPVILYSEEEPALEREG